MASFSDRLYALFGWRRPEAEAQIIFFGLDSSGKTTLLRRVAGMQLEHASIDDVRADDSRPAGAVSVDDITSSLPTQGHELKACRLFDTNVVAYDVGGARHLRHSWRKYYTTSAASAGVDAVVFVIDASDRRRTAEAGLALRQVHPGWSLPTLRAPQLTPPPLVPTWQLLDDDRLSGVPLLVWANKQDVPTALTPEQLVRTWSLSLHSSALWCGLG